MVLDRRPQNLQFRDLVVSLLSIEGPVVDITNLFLAKYDGRIYLGGSPGR